MFAKFGGGGHILDDQHCISSPLINIKKIIPQEYSLNYFIQCSEERLYRVRNGQKLINALNVQKKIAQREDQQQDVNYEIGQHKQNLLKKAYQISSLKEETIQEPIEKLLLSEAHFNPEAERVKMKYLDQVFKQKYNMVSDILREQQLRQSLTDQQIKQSKQNEIDQKQNNKYLGFKQKKSKKKKKTENQSELQVKQLNFLKNLDKNIKNQAFQDVEEIKKKEQEKQRVEEEISNFYYTLSSNRRTQYYVDPRSRRLKSQQQRQSDPIDFIVRKTFLQSRQSSMLSPVNSQRQSQTRNIVTVGSLNNSKLPRPFTVSEQFLGNSLNFKSMHTQINAKKARLTPDVQDVLNAGRQIPHSKNYNKVIKEGENIFRKLNQVFGSSNNLLL